MNYTSGSWLVGVLGIEERYMTVLEVDPLDAIQELDFSPISLLRVVIPLVSYSTLVNSFVLFTKVSYSPTVGSTSPLSTIYTIQSPSQARHTSITIAGAWFLCLLLRFLDAHVAFAFLDVKGGINLGFYAQVDPTSLFMLAHDRLDALANPPLASLAVKPNNSCFAHLFALGVGWILLCIGCRRTVLELLVVRTGGRNSELFMGIGQW